MINVYLGFVINVDKFNRLRYQLDPQVQSEFDGIRSVVENRLLADGIKKDDRLFMLVEEEVETHFECPTINKVKKLLNLDQYENIVCMEDKNEIYVLQEHADMTDATSHIYTFSFTINNDSNIMTICRQFDDILTPRFVIHEFSE